MWTDADRQTYRDQGGRYPSDLTDAQWATVAPLLISYDPLTADLREMVNACLYLEKTGCPWRYLPTDFGPPYLRHRSKLPQVRARYILPPRGRPPNPLPSAPWT